MPIKDYKCKQCESTKERIEYSGKCYGKMICDNCGSNMESHIGVSTFILKGSGWFKNNEG